MFQSKYTHHCLRVKPVSSLCSRVKVDTRFEYLFSSCDLLVAENICDPQSYPQLTCQPSSCPSQNHTINFWNLLQYILCQVILPLLNQFPSGSTLWTVPTCAFVLDFGAPWSSHRVEGQRNEPKYPTLAHLRNWFLAFLGQILPHRGLNRSRNWSDFVNILPLAGKKMRTFFCFCGNLI